jgi:hypothetical protein
MAQTSCCSSVSVVGVCLGEGGGTGGTIVLVSIPDNASTPANIPTVKIVGSYMLLVQPLTFPGACATFMASNADSGFAGSVARITNSPSPTDEEIDITWVAGNPIELYHSVVKTGGTGALITYRVLISSLS